MKVKVLQHVEFEGLGLMSKYFKYHSDDVEYIKLYDGDLIPELKEFDVLVIMGGPMGVFDNDKYSFLSQEKILIAQAIDAGKKVFGVCLGAQLIAHVLGANVYKNKNKEIGWFDIEVSEDCLNTIYGAVFEKPFAVFHWHSDTFDLPRNAIRLAKSEACQNQAFMLGSNVLALQFHLEMSNETIDRLFENCYNEIDESEYVQSKAEVDSLSRNVSKCGLKMYSLLDTFLGRSDAYVSSE